MQRRQRGRRRSDVRRGRRGRPRPRDDGGGARAVSRPASEVPRHEEVEERPEIAEAILDDSWIGPVAQDIAKARDVLYLGRGAMFPLALEGLIKHDTPLGKGDKVFVNCNLLWLTSPKVDLSSDKQEHFNHSRLVPQFSPRIPAYRADTAERLGAVIEQHVPLLAWVNHLQDAYFDQKSISTWTLEDDGKDPPHYPNASKNPFSQLTMVVPSGPANDPDRGPESPRHHPWSDKPRGNSRFDWVSLDQSLQWAAFRRLVEYLQSRGVDVFVMVGPFNEHMLAEENVPTCHALRDGIDAWLTQHRVPHVTPEALPSQLYADASHPLTAGYEWLAKRIGQDTNFVQWVERP
jgi:hypothetical protein